MAVFEKDPSAVLDYGFRFANWLASGETIVTSTWTVPTGLTENSDTNDGYTTAVWLSSGTDGKQYTITNHIVTSAGREDDRSHIIKCKQR